MRYYKPEEFTLLVELGVPLPTNINNCYDAFIMACKQQRMDVIDAILETNGVVPMWEASAEILDKILYKREITPEYYLWCNKEKAIVLATHGYVCNHKFNFYDLDPTHIDILLKAGAEPSIEICHWKKYSKSMLSLLLKGGADPNTRDNFGNTFIHKVLSEEIWTLFLDAGIDINTQNNNKVTPLMRLIRSSLDPTFALNNGANVNILDSEGRNCLFYINKRTPDEHIKILLNAGADINVTGVPDRVIKL